MLDRAQSAAPQDELSETRPVAFRGGGFAPKASRRAGWIALLVVIALWQFFGSAGLVNPVFLPTPSAILRAMVALAASGALWQHLAASLMRIGLGWFLGTL